MTLPACRRAETAAVVRFRWDPLEDGAPERVAKRLRGSTMPARTRDEHHAVWVPSEQPKRLADQAHELHPTLRRLVGLCDRTTEDSPGQSVLLDLHPRARERMFKHARVVVNGSVARRQTVPPLVVRQVTALIAPDGVGFVTLRIEWKAVPGAAPEIPLEDVLAGLDAIRHLDPTRSMVAWMLSAPATAAPPTTTAQWRAAMASDVRQALEHDQSISLRRLVMWMLRSVRPQVESEKFAKLHSTLYLDRTPEGHEIERIAFLASTADLKS